MRIAKKIIAVLLTVLTLMSVSAFSASAVTGPVFKLSIVSETDSAVVVKVTLEKGELSAMDIHLETSSAITGCTKFENSQQFKDVIKDYIINQGLNVTVVTNYLTMKGAVITSKPIKGKVDLFELTLTKKSSAPVKPEDINAVVDSCTLASDSSSASTGNIDLTDLVKIEKYFRDFKLIDTSISTNYKETVSIAYETNYEPSELTWTSSNDKVARVDENGNVYASGKGSATITVTSADGAVNETCEVEVTYTGLQWFIIIVLFGWIWY